MKEWTIFTKSDGLIGMLPSIVKKLPEGVKVITKFEGTEKEAVAFIEKYEKEHNHE